MYRDTLTDDMFLGNLKSIFNYEKNDLYEQPKRYQHPPDGQKMNIFASLLRRQNILTIK